MEDRRGEILVSGPAGTGKSRACLEKLHAQAKKYPGMRGLIVRKTLSSLGASALATWRKYVIPEDERVGTVGYYGGSSEEPPQYRYDNGSAIMIGGMDKPIRIMSTEYDVIYAQEAVELTIEDWESATSRLRNGVLPYQQIIADTNPSAPTNWLKLRCDSGPTQLYFSTHEENPVYFDEQGRPTPAGEAYIAKLDALTGVRYLRLRKGLWVAAEGVIYEDWDPSQHLIEPFPIPDSWPRFWSVDFGQVNPFVLQCWAESPDGILVLYREIYHSHKTVDQHAADIMAEVSREDPDHAPAAGDIAASGRIWTEPKPRAVICDHDGEGRAQLGRQLNLPIKPADKKVKEGIERVQVRLRLRADGRPGLMIMKGALVRRDPRLVEKLKPTCTVDEIPSYIWDIKDDGRTKDEPVKENDHGCDAMRYLVTYRDPISRPGLRTM